MAPTANDAKFWRNRGPHSAEMNAIHHLRRFNFVVAGKSIFPPKGFEWSKEEVRAVHYLVTAWGFTLND